MTGTDALTVARQYHQAWTSGRFDQAGGFLAESLRLEVPINSYASKDDFLAAVQRTHAMTSSVDLLAEFGSDSQALLLYDLALPIGSLQIAEHFLVSDGQITQIRHVHDTAALRAAGLGNGSVGLSGSSALGVATGFLDAW